MGEFTKGPVEIDKLDRCYECDTWNYISVNGQPFARTWEEEDAEFIAESVLARKAVESMGGNGLEAIKALPEMWDLISLAHHNTEHIKHEEICDKLAEIYLRIENENA